MSATSAKEDEWQVWLVGKQWNNSLRPEREGALAQKATARMGNCALYGNWVHSRMPIDYLSWDTSVCHTLVHQCLFSTLLKALDDL